jgi:hypothetical protein
MRGRDGRGQAALNPNFNRRLNRARNRPGGYTMYQTAAKRRTIKTSPPLRVRAGASAAYPSYIKNRPLPVTNDPLTLKTANYSSLISFLIINQNPPPPPGIRERGFSRAYKFRASFYRKGNGGEGFFCVAHKGGGGPGLCYGPGTAAYCGSPAATFYRIPKGRYNPAGASHNIF